MLLFTYGPKDAPELSECCPVLDGEDAGSMSKSCRMAWIYFGF